MFQILTIFNVKQHVSCNNVCFELCVWLAFPCKKNMPAILCINFNCENKSHKIY